MSTFSTCTSLTRPDPANDGDVLFETDTKNVIIWDGTNWRGYQNDGASGWSGTNAYSMNFDGTDDYLSLSSVVTSSATSGTISAWIKTNTNAFMPIFSAANNGVTTEWITLQVDSGGKFEIASNRLGTVDIYESSSTVTDNAWHHVMVTSNGSSYKLFLDGSEQTSASGNNTGTWIGDIGTKNSCNIGAMIRSAGSTYFNGNIDDVAIWNSDQSSNISTIYNSGTPGNLLSLSPNHWWRMGDGIEAGSGSTVYDMSNNAVNATIVNQANFDNTTAP